MLEATLMEQLAEYAETQRARVVEVCSGHRHLPAPDELTTPLGQGRILSARFSGGSPDSGREQALALLARELRSLSREHGQHAVPFLRYPAREKLSQRQAVVRRIQDYLDAVTSSCGLSCLYLVRRGSPLAVSGAPSALQKSRLDFLTRQAAAAARTNPTSSHAELCTSDVYAHTFYYDACLLGFADGPFSADFVRHRYRQVMPELAHLLSLLEDDPDDPADSAPRPE